MPFGFNRRPVGIQPMEAPTGKGKLIVTLGAAAAAAALAIVGQWEGKSNEPYEDTFVRGLLTVCYGETRVEMRRYTDAECEDMLADAVGDFGGAVLDRNPNLIDHPYALAAATSLSYNIGKSAYARSTAARRFAAGDIAGGCQAITRWNQAGGQIVNGLVNRRRAEYVLCMQGL